MKKDMRLELARQEIQKIDQEMAELFQKRMEAVEAVASYKRDYGLTVYDRRREDELLKRNRSYLTNPELEGYYRQFFSSLLRLSKNYQKSLLEGLTVAIATGKEKIGEAIYPKAKIITYLSYEEVYQALVKGEVNLAILPLENRSHGEIGQVTDLLFFGPLFINGVVNVFDRKSGDWIRYALLSDKSSIADKSYKDSLIILTFSVKNEAASLAQVLNVIGSQGYNIRMIRSRYKKELFWKHYFYLELEGNIQNARGEEMLEALSIFCDHLKLLGAFTEVSMEV